MLFKDYFEQKDLIKKQEELIDSQHDVIKILLDEISRRDQKIIEQIQQLPQKEVKNPDPLNFEFPGTEKYFDDFWNKLQKL